MAGRDCHGTWKYWPASGPVSRFIINGYTDLFSNIYCTSVWRCPVKEKNGGFAGDCTGIFGVNRGFSGFATGTSGSESTSGFVI